MGPILAKLFVFKNLAPSATRYHVQLSSCTISEKTNTPILRKLSDGWMDGQTDQSDFIGRCPTNHERPKIKCQKHIRHNFQQKKRNSLIFPQLLCFSINFPRISQGFPGIFKILSFFQVYQVFSDSYQTWSLQFYWR